MSFPVLDDLRKARLAKGITISDIAEQSGISEPTVSKLFSGRQDDAKLTTISDIASVLDLEIRAVQSSTQEPVQPSCQVDSVLFNQSGDHKDRLIRAQGNCIKLLFGSLLFVVVLFAVLLLLAGR